MATISPQFLLTHPELVTPVAPWCCWLDNLEMAVLMLAQPWLAGGGLRRSELEHSLSNLGHDLPVGPVYFQRVNRATATLEAREQLESVGKGRQRRFVVTAKGFAALVLNLQVLRTDPTIDGSEFELKRWVVVMCSLILSEVNHLDSVDASDPAIAGFVKDVDALEIWGRQVVTETAVTAAFDVNRLVKQQFTRVQNMLLDQQRRLQQAEESARMLDGATTHQADDPLAEMTLAAHRIAAGAMPRMSAECAVERYGSYLIYLEKLGAIFRRTPGAPDLQ